MASPRSQRVLCQFFQRAAVDDLSQETPRIPYSLREPLAPVLTTSQQVAEFSKRLADGEGPIAIDAERASGFTYSQKAYLIQLRRKGSGTALIDPISADLAPISGVAHETEWVLHAATQDLECLREVGLEPTKLFDTELAGRLLGREKVGLAGLIDSELGEFIEKGHGAANWSMRPLTEEMLKYAALDVELLLELRTSLEESLKDQNKWHIAQQEFHALVTWSPRQHTAEAWRRTSGVHSIRSPRIRAIVRELWITRDDIARRRDIAPGRILPDRSIIAAAVANPGSRDALFAIKEFNGRGAKKYDMSWWAAIERANSLPESELPGSPPRSDAPPPPKVWIDKNPAAHARLDFARTQLGDVSHQLSIPVENLMLPDLVRRVLWEPPPEKPSDLMQRLRESGAREWQIDLVFPILWASREAPLHAQASGSQESESPSEDVP